MVLIFVIMIVAVAMVVMMMMLTTLFDTIDVMRKRLRRLLLVQMTNGLLNFLVLERVTQIRDGLQPLLQNVLLSNFASRLTFLLEIFFDAILVPRL